jgi:uncharacterized tellurite resistance protein B-like protein
MVISMFRRFLNPPSRDTERIDEPPPEAAIGETATIRRIVARLEALPPDEARYLAGFAYVMSRAAQADLHISDEETRVMERAVIELGGLDEAQAVLVVQMAKLQARVHGGTEDFLVTREFAKLASEEQKLAVLRCCFLVGAADASISSDEASVVNQIARELDVERSKLNAVREEFVERFALIQQMRHLQDRHG